MCSRLLYHAFMWHGHLCKNLCLRCASVVIVVLRAQKDWPFKGSLEYLWYVSFINSYWWLFVVCVAFLTDLRLFLYLVCCMWHWPSNYTYFIEGLYLLPLTLFDITDLNRFTMSRYSICKSSVTVSFPLTGLDLGPFGPVDCGERCYFNDI